MSVEQKVCQLFITRPEEVTGVTQFTQAGKKTQESLCGIPTLADMYSELATLTVSPQPEI